MWRRALLVWVLLVGLAILNGAARETVLSPRLGPIVGHLASSVLLAGLIALTAWLSILWIAPGTARRAWAVAISTRSTTTGSRYHGAWSTSRPPRDHDPCCRPGRAPRSTRTQT